MLIAVCFVFSGEGNREFRKEEEQDTHTVCEVRPPQLPLAEEPLLRLRLPGRSQEDMYVISDFVDCDFIFCTEFDCV